jgi:hypothetical protein
MSKQQEVQEHKQNGVKSSGSSASPAREPEKLPPAHWKQIFGFTYKYPTPLTEVFNSELLLTDSASDNISEKPQVLAEARDAFYFFKEPSGQQTYSLVAKQHIKAGTIIAVQEGPIVPKRENTNSLPIICAPTQPKAPSSSKNIVGDELSSKIYNSVYEKFKVLGATHDAWIGEGEEGDFTRFIGNKPTKTLDGTAAANVLARAYPTTYGGIRIFFVAAQDIVPDKVLTRDKSRLYFADKGYLELGKEFRFIELPAAKPKVDGPTQIAATVSTSHSSSLTANLNVVTHAAPLSSRTKGESAPLRSADFHTANVSPTNTIKIRRATASSKTSAEAIVFHQSNTKDLTFMEKEQERKKSAKTLTSSRK